VVCPEGVRHGGAVDGGTGDAIALLEPDVFIIHEAFRWDESKRALHGLERAIQGSKPSSSSALAMVRGGATITTL
jgi:hypothetical protein